MVVVKPVELVHGARQIAFNTKVVHFSHLETLFPAPIALMHDLDVIRTQEHIHLITGVYLPIEISGG